MELWLLRIQGSSKFVVMSSNRNNVFYSFSEKSKTKCIGITIETRPDYCLNRHLRYSIIQYYIAFILHGI